MKFAVATHSFLLTIEFDQQWRPIDHQVLGTGYHYGIGLCCSQNNQPATHFTAYRGGPALAEQVDRELITYQNSQNFPKVAVQRLDESFDDVHQIAQSTEGLYLANTGRNSLVYLANDGRRHEYFFDDLNYDYNHVNSVFPYGNKMLVMLHNKAHKESQVVVMNHDQRHGFTRDKSFSLWEIGCHNVYVEGKQLFYNGSRENRFVQADLAHSRINQTIRLDGHTKGMSVSDGHILIGMSEHTVRDQRARSKGYLVVIDKSTLAVTATVDINFPDLPHPVGNINEIRNLSAPDRAHDFGGAPAFNWSKVTMAESQQWQHKLFQVKTTTLKPLRRLKQKLLGYQK
jgi:hypothetical protein